MRRFVGQRLVVVVAAIVGCLVGAIIALTNVGGATSPSDTRTPVLPAGTTAAAPPIAAAPAPKPEPVRPVAVSAQLLANLPPATTFGTIRAAPLDTDSAASTDGTIVHPQRTTPVYAKPGGKPIAALPDTEVGGPTWLPVIDQRADWVRVLLPARPNGATGWLWAGGVGERALVVKRSIYEVHVNRATFKLHLERAGKTIGVWTVGTGKPIDPTPHARTFIMGAITDTGQTYSPVILPLGVHSPTLDTFGGGPGTVAIHTWPSSWVYGTESSNGCIRIPPDALRAVEAAPLGTLVIIT